MRRAAAAAAPTQPALNMRTGGRSGVCSCTFTPHCISLRQFMLNRAANRVTLKRVKQELFETGLHPAAGRGRQQEVLLSEAEGIVG